MSHVIHIAKRVSYLVEMHNIGAAGRKVTFEQVGPISGHTILWILVLKLVVVSLKEGILPGVATIHNARVSFRVKMQDVPYN